MVAREVFTRGLYTFSGLGFGPNGLLYAASVLTGEIVAIDANGDVVRRILDPSGLLPPIETGHPQGIAFDAAGRPRPPEILVDGLEFPDGVAVMPDRSD